MWENDLKLEPLPNTSVHYQPVNNKTGLNYDEIIERLETGYLERIQKGENEFLFSLGQLYFERNEFERAASIFERAKPYDLQAVYQLAVINFDGIGKKPNYKCAICLLRQVAECDDPQYVTLRRCAQYNLALAYLQGFGVTRSDEETEKWLLCAADDGNPDASIKAQHVLGLFYSRPTAMKNLKKSFFWHNEATGNGNMESQAALGVMYLYGLGTKTDYTAAFECFRRSAERGNVYAMGMLVACYYKRRMFTKCIELSTRISALSPEDVHQISIDTDCLQHFVRKGIAIACFYYARCLDRGLGVQRDTAQARQFYAKAVAFDSDVSAKLQNETQLGQI